MTTRPRGAQPAPTMHERAEAARSARALRAAIADSSTMGERQVMHCTLARPRRGVWLTTWSKLPGFIREDGRDGTSYSHTALPGWSYARSEIKTELIPDLELLAERGVRPTQATRAA